MSTTVIVTGPQGCGKTRMSRAIAAHFGISKVVDGWDGESEPPRDALLLTSVPGNQLSLHEALALAARVPGNDFVQAVCAQFSGVFVPVPEPGRAGVADLLVAQAEVMRRYGEVSASFADAWRDGRITQLELDELSAGARRAVSAMLAFVNEVSTLAEEDGSGA